jgi:S1-C subfamily serine protease
MRRTFLPMLLLAAAAPIAGAQQSGTVAPRARTFTMNRAEDDDRAMLGVITGSSGKRDTLGLLVESVTPGSPADKAGIEEGNRIASINGVSLKLSRGDAGEPDMSSMMTNRLVREMRKLKAGDEATLEVWNGSRSRAVKVKTVAADDLAPERVTRREAADRPALGISLGSSGSKRDTLGVFVSGVTENGPADKAGIVEGDRVASVNGVDLRVPKEDVGDWSAASARVARLQREIRKLKPGQTVDLSVVEAGRARTVKVTLGRASDLERESGFSFSTGDGGSSSFMMPRVPVPPVAPRIREELDRVMPRVRDEIDRELPQAMDEVRREMDRLRIEMPLVRYRMGRGVII